ncbi:MAG TPA: hypothetical protein VIX86_27580 [Streptosporangiaceae bacterium]
MTDEHTITGPNGGAVPVACTLTRAGLAGQVARWQRLAARAMTGRAETGDGVRLSFRPGPGVEEELRTLVATEKQCCPWADWTVETDARHVVLGIRSTGVGIAALRSMFTELPTAHGPA